MAAITTPPGHLLRQTTNSEVNVMFSVKQKREISEAVQRILRETGHDELPKTGEIRFTLIVEGPKSRAWANIRNNGAVDTPSSMSWTEINKLKF